ncbi:unnamed protein product [Calypogeia fissa]
MKPVYKIRGHTGSILGCVTSPNSPDEVVTCSEDGSVRVFDLRSQSCATAHQCLGGESVASISLNPGNSTELYAAAGAVVYCLDRRLGSSGRELQRYDFNLDEINQVAVNQKGSYVAAADDSGEIKVIDVHNCRLYRTLRGGHTNICSAVQFHPQKPWEVISGGLDSKIVKWDFSKGKYVRSVNLVADNANVGQLCNPPFVHALAIPESNGSGDSGRVVAVARGDGAIEVYDLGFESLKPVVRKGLKNKKGNQQNSSGQGESGGPALMVNGLRCHFDTEHGGHSTAASSVAFAAFGANERFLVSAGNDMLIKGWNWRSSPDGCQADNGSGLVLNIQHGKKINWLSTIDRQSGNLVVADTSKVLSVYHIL